MGIRAAGLPFVGGTNLMSHPSRRCWCRKVETEKIRQRGRETNVVFGCTGAPTFDTHSVVHLVVLGYWRCYQRKTGSYGWSLEGSAFLGPDDSQQQSVIMNQLPFSREDEAVISHIMSLLFLLTISIPVQSNSTYVCWLTLLTVYYDMNVGLYCGKLKVEKNKTIRADIPGNILLEA